MQRVILNKAGDFGAARLLCGNLSFNLGAVVLGILSSICLLPSHPAMSQSPTFHGVQVSQKFDTNSDLADLIKKSTTGSGQHKFSKAKLGQWVVFPRSQDKYYTYEIQEFTVRKTFKAYVVFLLSDTTSNNPKYLSLAVDCAENKLSQKTYRTFSSRGDTVTKQSVDKPWAAPTNSFFQGLVNEVCKLGS
jgi:hypothetical protein